MRATDDWRKMMLAMRFEPDIPQDHHLVIALHFFEGALQKRHRIVRVAGKPILVSTGNPRRCVAQTLHDRGHRQPSSAACVWRLPLLREMAAASLQSPLPLIGTSRAQTVGIPTSKPSSGGHPASDICRLMKPHRGFERRAACILKDAARPDDGLFSDDAGPADFAYAPTCIGDAPVARNQLYGRFAAVFNGNADKPRDNGPSSGCDCSSRKSGSTAI